MATAPTTSAVEPVGMEGRSPLTKEPRSGRATAAVTTKMTSIARMMPIIVRSRLR